MKYLTADTVHIENTKTYASIGGGYQQNPLSPFNKIVINIPHLGRDFDGDTCLFKLVDFLWLKIVGALTVWRKKELPFLKLR